jgi:hypothetical protein
MERLLEGRLLFTGDHGDTIWDPHSLRVSEEIKRGDPGGCAFEFRSRVGFLLFPVPFAGAVNHPDIHRVSNSEEMRPWLLGRGSYDRPIPRRIVEERGVARDLFGQAKKVVAQAFLPTTGELEDLATLLSPHTHARFRAFCDSLPRSVTEHRVTFARGMRLLREASLRFVWRAERIARALGRPRLFRAPFERYRLPLSAHNFTFVWANGLVVARYAEALGRGSPDRSIAPLATSR